MASPTQHKRVRTDDVLGDKLKAVQVTESEPDCPIICGANGNQSYASMLLNPLHHYRNAPIENFEFADEDCVHSMGNTGPNTCFSQRLHDKLDLEWRCAVIIKLMGKPNSSNALKFMADSLRRKWNPQGPWQIIDLPNDYFVVKFHLHEDMGTALYGGPWIIAGQTLVVQQWKPNFNPSLDEITTMAIWVRIVGLPPKFFKEFTMRKIGHSLGSVVKVDKLTLSQTRGQFGRLCVEIDLQKPLLPRVEVEGISYGVVYEGISMICFQCGCYGHVKASCPYHVSDQTPNQSPDANVSKSDIAINHTNDVGSARAMENSDGKTDRGTQSVAGGGHGPWMLMSYRNKKREVIAPENSKTRATYGSRFAILEDEADGIMKNAEVNVDTEIPSKPIVPSDPEPKIVTLWKQVQKKIHNKNKNEDKTQATKGTRNPVTDSNAKAKTGSSKPMMDITNGNLNVGNTMSKASYSKSRKTGASNKSSTTPSSAMNFTFPHPDLSPLMNGKQPDPPNQDVPLQQNVSAYFGHCPPENGSLNSSLDGDVGISNHDSSNDQAHSDFSSTNLQLIDVIPDMDQEFCDAEPSLAGNTSSLNEEEMVDFDC